MPLLTAPAGSYRVVDPLRSRATDIAAVLEPESHRRWLAGDPFLTSMPFTQHGDLLDLNAVQATVLTQQGLVEPAGPRPPVLAA